MTSTQLLSIGEILVDNKYGVATVMSPGSFCARKILDIVERDSNKVAVAESSPEEIDESCFRIPTEDNSSSPSFKKVFRTQEKEEPEAFFTIPKTYKNYSNWGKKYRESSNAKNIIDAAAEHALRKLNDDNYKAIEDNNGRESQEKHSIVEAINLAAEKATSYVETVVFANRKSPIILIHGFRGAPLGLKAIQEELQKASYKVYCPELPPFAGAKKLNNYTPREYAAYFANFITKNQIHKPILVGHSMGSIVAAATAMHCADITNDKLILMSPISTKTPKMVSVVSPLQNFVPNKIISYATTRFLAVEEDKAMFKSVIDITNQCSLDRPPSRSELMRATKFSTNYSVGDFIFKKRTLLLAGEKDRLIRASDTARLAEKIEAETSFLPHTGHLHNYEKPVETAQEILKFIER